MLTFQQDLDLVLRTFDLSNLCATPIGPDLTVDVTVASECDRVDLEVWMQANDRIKPVAVYPDIFLAR